MYEENNEEELYEEEELDEELVLPEDLRGLPISEKIQLLNFKKSHTEVEWEAEMMRRIDMVSRQKDLERLTKMAGGTSPTQTTSKRSASSTKKRKGKTSAKEKKSSKKRGSTKRRSKITSDDEEEEDESEDDEDEDESLDGDLYGDNLYEEGEEGEEDEGALSSEEEEEDEEDDDDDDLFDSDEDAEISAKLKKNKKKSVGSKKSNKKAASASKRRTKRSRMDEYEDEEEEVGGVYSDDAGSDSGYAPVMASRQRFPRPGDSDDEDNDMPKSLKKVKSTKVEEPPAKYEDYLNVQVRRELAIRYEQDPHFKNSIIGCFVRYWKKTAGHANAGEYMMCEIAEVTKKTYSADGAAMETGIIVSIGGKRYPRIVKFSEVSNSRISPEEFNNYMKSLTELKVKPYLTSELNKRKTIFRALSNRVISSEEIKKKIAMSGLVMESKANLLAQLDYARQENDEEAVHLIQKKIAKLDRETELNKEMIQKAGQRTSELNKKTREINSLVDKNVVKRKLNDMTTTTGSLTQMHIPSIYLNANSTISQLVGRSADAQQSTTTADYIGEQFSSDLDSCLGLGRVSMMRVRENIFNRIGIDPFENIHKSKRELYLEKVCSHLPPLGSVERDQQRPGLSLKQYLQHLQGNLVSNDQ